MRLWRDFGSDFLVIFINLEFLDAGVFPVLELRFKTEREGGVDGGVLQFEGTGVGDFVHGDAFVQFSDLVGDVGAAHGDVLITSGVDQEVVVVQLQHLFPFRNDVQVTEGFGPFDVFHV